MCSVLGSKDSREQKKQGPMLTEPTRGSPQHVQTLVWAHWAHGPCKQYPELCSRFCSDLHFVLYVFCKTELKHKDFSQMHGFRKHHQLLKKALSISELYHPLALALSEEVFTQEHRETVEQLAFSLDVLGPSLGKDLFCFGLCSLITPKKQRSFSSWALLCI